MAKELSPEQLKVEKALLSALADMTGMTDEEKALAVWPDEE